MPNLISQEILMAAVLAVVLILLLKLIWKVVWGFINWISDLYLNSKYKDTYERLTPMYDYVPFWDVFADEQTRERRMIKNYSLGMLKKRMEKGEV